MYNKILVPLDGSEMAECVLPHVENIAKGCKVGNVTFLRVLDTYMPSAARAYLGTDQEKEMNKKSEEAAIEYLDRVAGRVNLNGVEMQKHLIIGHPAENIADYASNNNVDLIIIATHGRSGISRWVWGSVANRILRSACVPVLMVRAPGCIPGI